MTRFTDIKYIDDSWFDVWFKDHENMLNTMVRNMQSDLKCGYNPNSISILRQKLDIEEYKLNYENQMNQFHKMTEKEVEKFCFYDLKKRGVIE